MTKGEELPARKFITHAQGGKDGTPYGLGLGSKLYWPVVFKRQSISFWLAYAERVGTPTVVATHPELMPSDQIDKVAAAADGVGQESSITIPNSVVLNLLEPKSGNVAYQPLVDYMDKQISIAVLGETLTTNSSPTGMGSSTATVHNEVRLELTEADAVLLAGTLNATLVKWLVELNLGHNDVPRVAWDFSKPEDLKVRAERDEIVGRMSGTRPTLKYVQDTYGGEWEPVAPVAPPDPVNAPLAAKAALSTVVGEIGQDAENNLSDAATPLVDDLLQSVQKMVNDAPDMGALQTALLQAYGGLNSDDLVKLMAAAFALAELKGMDDVAHAQ
jgi:phage gp29-like protein